MNFEKVAEFTRYNSGRALCDSGDFYGRHYESPLPEGKIVHDDRGFPSISLTHFLADHCELLDDIQCAFDETAENDKELSWWEVGSETMKHLGYTQVFRGNTYKDNTDLSQDFVCEVWEKELSEDWILNNNAVLVLYIHTGCDVRGGYSPPLAVTFNGDYSFPCDLSLEWNCEKLDAEDNLKFEAEYSSSPRYEIERQGYKFLRRDGEEYIFEQDGQEFPFRCMIPYQGD